MLLWLISSWDVLVPPIHWLSSEKLKFMHGKNMCIMKIEINTLQQHSLNTKTLINITCTDITSSSHDNDIKNNAISFKTYFHDIIF